MGEEELLDEEGECVMVAVVVVSDVNRDIACCWGVVTDVGGNWVVSLSPSPPLRGGEGVRRRGDWHMMHLTALGQFS